MRFGRGGPAGASRGAETDQGGVKMSIDTGEKKDLGSSQTIAQWFAPEIQGRI
jgi:hypothetical protein